MIGIITYVSVVERTKEIGILRSIGARKKDISRVFIAESVIIGFTAGVIGVILATLLVFPINAIIERAVDAKNFASLPEAGAAALVGISVALTFVAGLIPSKIAANKDPVAALRTE
jgi:putative ABC transport system permease protein